MLDRALQRQLLETLSRAYPAQIGADAFEDIVSEVLTPNLAYLEDHGLVAITWRRMVSEPDEPGLVRATAKGMDFLADDGGLSAILGVVTVKLHEDTIKTLLIERLQATPAPEGVKSKLIARIKELPAKGVETIATEGFKAGLDKVDDLIEFLQRLM